MLSPCKHLDYDDNKVDCEIIELPGFNFRMRYWKRNNVPYEGAAVKVQFCKKFGRIAGISACYDPGDSHCHEPVINTDDV